MFRMACVGWLLLLATLGPIEQTATQGKNDQAKPRSDDALRQELLRMVKVDQDARKDVIKTPSPTAAALDKLAEIDRKNTARLKKIVEKNGWPGKSLVGEDGAHAAWLLVQHADRDREFQKRCLTFLERAVKAREASAIDLAYLTDRVLVAENKHQVYGTQFRVVDGKMQPYPITDEKNVDRRRKEAGLPSLAEYQKAMEEMYRPRTKRE